MSTDTDAELTYGGLDFLGDTFHALAPGRSHGAPEPLVIALQRLLMDGELLTHERDGNRELSFRVEVTGDDVLALNEAEAELVREANKPLNQIRWKPAGMNTPVTVFWTFAGYVAQVFDEEDDLEEMRGKRVYSVTIPALPHARSETLHTASLAGRSSVTLLDNCDSLTNWGQVGPIWVTPTLDTTVHYAGTGSLKVTGTHNVYADGTGGGSALGWKRSASFSVGAGGHLVALLRSNYPMGGQPGLYYTATSVPATATSLVSAAALTDGWVEYTWALNNETPMTVTSFHIDPIVGTPAAAGTYTITAWLDQVQTFTAAPPTSKAGLRLLQTGGSVRTPGTLRISNASTALGSVLVATWADLGDGYRPDVARWYTTGGVASSSSGSVSGQSFTTSATFDVPNSTLAPGPYAVLVKPSAGLLPTSVQVIFQTRIGGTATGPASAILGKTTDDLTITALGVVHLPSSATPVESAGVTRLSVDINGPTGSAIDELWLVRLDGQMTWLNGLTSRRVWIESPSPSLPYGGVWVGDAADMSDARHPGDALKMLGRHVFESPVAAVYVAATGAPPAMDLLHYRTWHSNAAD